MPFLRGPSDHQSSEVFRARAEEARVIAATYRDPVARDQMLRVAADCDWMAEYLERREADATPVLQ